MPLPGIGGSRFGVFGLLNGTAASSAAVSRSGWRTPSLYPRHYAAAPRGTGERIPPQGFALPLRSACGLRISQVACPGQVEVSYCRRVG